MWLKLSLLVLVTVLFHYHQLVHCNDEQIPDFDDGYDDDNVSPKKKTNDVEVVSDGTHVWIGSKDDSHKRMFLACIKGDKAELNKAIHQGANVNAFGPAGLTPLNVAASYGNTEIVGLLLQKGAEIDKFDADEFQTPLFTSCVNGTYDVGDLLIRRGASLNMLNERGDSAISIAAYHGHDNLVALLLKKKAKHLDKQTKDTGYTALHFAAYKGHLLVVKMLVKAKCDIDMVDKDGRSPIMLAAMEGHKEVVKFLISKDADLDIQDQNGFNALMLAVSYNKKYVVPSILDSGCIVKLANFRGETPLLIAAILGYQDLIKLLVLHGVDIMDEVNKDGKNAIELAEENNHTEAAQFLRQFL